MDLLLLQWIRSLLCPPPSFFLGCSLWGFMNVGRQTGMYVVGQQYNSNVVEWMLLCRASGEWVGVCLRTIWNLIQVYYIVRCLRSIWWAPITHSPQYQRVHYSTLRYSTLKQEFIIVLYSLFIKCGWWLGWVELSRVGLQTFLTNYFVTLSGTFYHRHHHQHMWISYCSGLLKYDVCRRRRRYLRLLSRGGTGSGTIRSYNFLHTHNSLLFK